MSSLTRIYNRLIDAMAFIAATLLVWLMVAIVLSVVIRNLGVQSPAWLFSSTEYSMFYLTLLGAPWLVREKGHVYIEIVINQLPETVQRLLSRLVMVICAVICFVLAVKGTELVATNIDRVDYDVRTYYFPMWMLTITYPISFSLMGLEFLRFVFSRDTYHGNQTEAL
ncbi:TRAP transporter small permease [Alloalcanivorax sp. C16-2]|uniref:TRAP transporter small permease n=1 Tax=Alloalcanivorax sp. C16-2 TaxID=3390052 RepID=UPI003970CBB3